MTHSLLIRQAAAIVRAILNGAWTNEPPAWADADHYYDVTQYDSCAEHEYTRAVQTAEAFILLFSQADPTFSETAFLRACHLTRGSRRTD